MTKEEKTRKVNNLKRKYKRVVLKWDKKLKKQEDFLQLIQLIAQCIAEIIVIRNELFVLIQTPVGFESGRIESGSNGEYVKIPKVNKQEHLDT